MAAHGTAHASGSRCMAALSAGHVGAGGLYPEGKGRGVEQRGARFISRRFLLLARHPNPEMLRPQALNPQPLNPSTLHPNPRARNPKPKGLNPEC